MHPSERLDHRLAWLGLVLNGLGLPALVQLLASGGTMAVANWAVGTSAILPALVLGVVASAALVKRRRWGRVVAIVALGLSLAVSLSYGVVWLVLVPLGRPLVAVALGVTVVAELLSLIYWCLPRPWWRRRMA
jgi:peptidoglycan/LPS O-acetylase OafA/YrhL